MKPIYDEDGITIFNAKCEDVLPTLPDHSFDAVICDPPYGTTACAWDTVIEFGFMWEQLKRLIKPRGAIVLFGSQPFTSALVMSNPKWFRYEWIWRKSKASGFLDARRKPMPEHEEILVFGEGVLPYYPQMNKGKNHTRSPLGGKATQVYGKFEKNPSASDEFFPRTVLDVKNAYYTDGQQCHPTQKPLALLDYLIRTYTNEGDTILDFAMGSGTTLVGAKVLKRKAVGIDSDTTEGYCGTAIDRVKQTELPLFATLYTPVEATQEVMFNALESHK